MNAIPESDLLTICCRASSDSSTPAPAGNWRIDGGVLNLLYDDLERNLDSLYDNVFIETCADWMVPYIATLVAVPGLRDPDLLFPEQRALVGNAIALRRRKGVATALQPLVRGACGWYALMLDLGNCPPPHSDPIVLSLVWW